MAADFTWSCRACSGVLSLWGSCRGLAVLGSCFSGVQEPLGTGAALWVTENLRGSSLGHSKSEGQPENVGGSFYSLAELVAAFLGCRGSSRGLVVLCSYSREWGTPWGLGRVAGPLETQEAPPQGSPTQKDSLRM